MIHVNAGSSLRALLDPAQNSSPLELPSQVTGRLLGLVDAGRTWFRSSVSLDAAQPPHDIPFCNSALASNAIKHGREGGQIKIGARAAENAAAWSAVQDNGAGLTPEQLGRLFKPFDRLGQEHGTVPGTALGPPPEPRGTDSRPMS